MAGSRTAPDGYVRTLLAGCSPYLSKCSPHRAQCSFLDDCFLWHIGHSTSIPIWPPQNPTARNLVTAQGSFNSHGRRWLYQIGRCGAHMKKLEPSSFNAVHYVAIMVLIGTLCSYFILRIISLERAPIELFPYIEASEEVIEQLR
jgi:hypothetical protein